MSDGWELDIPGAVPVERGCGYRGEDGVYSECGLAPWGTPLEMFILEGIPVPADLHVSAIGVTLVEDQNGVTHIVDWVGEDSYPYPADFVEEVRRYGMSRRLPSTLDFSRLTDASTHMLIHPKARMIVAEHDQAKFGEVTCPRGRHEDHVCAGLWWHDLGGDAPERPAGDVRQLRPGEKVTRRLAATQYEGWVRPDAEVTYEPGFFLRLPISRLAIIQGQRTAELQERVGAAALPVVVVPE